MVVATIGHSEYKDVLLNLKCIRHTMNRIESKHHRIRTSEILQNFNVLFWWQKLYQKHWIQWISSWVLKLIVKTVIYLERFFVKHIVLIISLIGTSFLSRY